MTTKEQRRSPRVEVDFVTVEVYHEHAFTTEQEDFCPVANLSLTGMCFSSERDFSHEPFVRLTFQLPESMVIIRATAKIIHTFEDEHRQVFYGVEFENMGAAEKKEIEHYVQMSIDKTM